MVVHLTDYDILRTCGWCRGEERLIERTPLTVCSVVGTGLDPHRRGDRLGNHQPVGINIASINLPSQDHIKAYIRA